MRRQTIQESEQTITTQGHIISSFKERIILLHRDCHLVEKFFTFERRIINDQGQRSSTGEKYEKKGTG